MARSGGRSRTQTPQLQVAYMPRRACAADMRAALRGFLLERRLDPAAVRDIVLAAEEAFSNAVVHADGEGLILVSAIVDDGEARVEVHDLGHGFDPAAVDAEHIPGRDRVHGRGLFLMRRVMDRVEISSGEGGTTVHLVRRTA